MAASQTIPAPVWFIKRNISPEISRIEQKIYQALKQDPAFEGMALPAVKEHSGQAFLVESCGTTLADCLHSGTYSSTEKMRADFEGYLECVTRARTRVNQVIATTITPEEKEFLINYHHQKLRSSLYESTGEEVSEAELKTNYWAYRLMNALGFYDAQFKEAYTNIIGAKLEHYTIKFGQWLSDNTLRNNASPDGKTVVPFDFNSIKFGPMQIDDAAVAGLYLLAGPLAIYRSPPEIDTLVHKLQEWKGKEYDAEYSPAFFAAAFHENAVIAGYRTKTAQKLLAEIERIGIVTRNSGFEFRSCFDEIEYHHDVPVLISRYLPKALVSTDEEYGQLGWIADTISHNTFAQRSLMMLSPAWGPIMRVTN